MEFEAVARGGPGREPASARPDGVRLELPNPRAETTVEFAMTGGHVLSLAVAACVLNDVYREAQALGITVDRCEVHAGGGFAGTPMVSTGITYTVSIDSPDGDDRIQELLTRVDEVAEIPATLRIPTEVRRVDV